MGIFRNTVRKNIGITFLILFALVGSVHIATQSAAGGAEAAFARESVTVTGLDVALKTLSFVESIPEKDGLLVYLQNCQEDKCTFHSNTFPQTRAWVALAYVGLYNATGDTVYFDKIKESMELLAKDCEPPDSNPSGDCRFLGVQAEAAYEATGDNRYLDYLPPIGDNPSIIRASDAEASLLSAIMSRQAALAYKHQFYDNPFAVHLGIRHLYNTLPERETLLIDNGIALQQTACWTYVAEAEFYDVLDEVDDGKILFRDMNAQTLQASLLAEPKYFFNQFSFENASSRADIYYLLTLTDLESCAEAALELYDITGEELYRQQAITILQGMLDRHWDSEYAQKHTGDNAFLAQGCRTNSQDGFTCYRNRKVLTDNAYAVYLFSRLPNEVFSITTDVPVQYLENPEDDQELTQPEPVLPPTEALPKEPTLRQLHPLLLLVLIVAFIVGIITLRKKTHEKSK